jgi:transcriptional regulator with XRE-family HTH domain
MADTIAVTIRRLRGDTHPDDFARRIGVHPRSVYKFENGERVPSTAVLVVIAEKFGVDLGDLARTAARKPPKRAPRRRPLKNAG